jgi:hypothetical protein
MIDEQPPSDPDFMETLSAEAHNQAQAGIVEIFNQGDEKEKRVRDSDSEDESDEPDEDDENSIDSEEDID